MFHPTSNSCLVTDISAYAVNQQLDLFCSISGWIPRQLFIYHYAKKIKSICVIYFWSTMLFTIKYHPHSCSLMFTTECLKKRMKKFNHSQSLICPYQHFAVHQKSFNRNYTYIKTWFQLHSIQTFNNISW